MLVAVQDSYSFYQTVPSYVILESALLEIFYYLYLRDSMGCHTGLSGVVFALSALGANPKVLALIFDFITRVTTCLSCDQGEILTVLSNTTYSQFLIYLIGLFNLSHVGSVSNTDIDITMNCNVPKQ